MSAWPQHNHCSMFSVVHELGEQMKGSLQCELLISCMPSDADTVERLFWLVWRTEQKTTVPAGAMGLEDMEAEVAVVGTMVNGKMSSPNRWVPNAHSRRTSNWLTA